MANSIKLTAAEWGAIKLQLENDYPRSVMLIRSVMLRELGFTTRSHRVFDASTYDYVESIYLDFFDDAKETFFRLRYL